MSLRIPKSFPSSAAFRLFLTLLFAVAIPVIAVAQTSAPPLPGLQWRLIGPFRAGRVTAVSGVAGDPNTFYFGTPGGGVWKTTSGGQVWQPIFDRTGVPSIGSLAVAPSDRRVIYVGTGEQTRGSGIYRSSDEGKTWKNVGLNDALFIQEIIVDPRNPDVLVAAANSLGMGLLWTPLPRWAFTANRGIFKSTDGGKTWKKTFADDSTIGAVDMCSDPNDPKKMFAAIFRPASDSDPKSKPTSYIVTSTDEGSTWIELKVSGLPPSGRNRLGIAVAAGTGGRRLYAIMKQGFFRSDDGGATWVQSTKDPRVIGSSYFSRIFTDPQNPDLLYVAQTSLYRSTDGGKTFEAYVGAPSGDDFHVLWIDPQQPARMILGVDQGAIISVDSGKTWSSWYNQPTGQFYHVSTDNEFPYRVYGAQQDSGTASVLSRSDKGEILAQDWYPVGGFEYAFITPDPKHPNYVYSGGWYGSVVRFDKSTGQIATIFEHGNKYRMGQMPPLVFSPQDPSVLYLGAQYVLKTSDGGQTWTAISPDLTGYIAPKEEEDSESVRTRPPAITAIAPSAVDANEIWAGTSNRFVYVTRDSGRTWQNVTPPGLAEPVQILYVEPSHYDAGTSYVTCGGTRESTPPCVYRTTDFGQNWQKIVNGLPENEMVRVVREDPKRKGLLYAGTDTTVFMSFNDGANWQPLTLNLPPSPVTDLQVHDNDIAISTFGRALWILDDVNPLRQLTPEVTASDVHLFAPANALRVRWDTYPDTPYPVETPAGKNPPNGAILDYFLKNAPAQKLTLTIYDDKGAEVTSFSSEATPRQFPPANVPEYWFRSPVRLPENAGVNRFVWNLRYPAPATLPFSYYGELLEYTEYTLADETIAGETPREQPQGPFVAPGKYIAELRYGTKVLRQPFTVEPDPRITATQQDLLDQQALALLIVHGMKSSYDSFMQVVELEKSLSAAANGTRDQKVKDAAAQLEKKLDSMKKGTDSSPGFGIVNRNLARLLYSVESADQGPTSSVRTAVQETCNALGSTLAKWKEFNEQDVKSWNQSVASGAGQSLASVSASPTGCQ